MHYIKEAKVDVEHVGVVTEMYRHFVQLLHKCSAVNHQSQSSLQIDTIKSFFAKAEESNPLDDTELIHGLTRWWMRIKL